MIYEYAGFKYEITGEGDRLTVKPVKGQHPAASKAKHIMAAREQYLEDRRRELRRV